MSWHYISDHNKVGPLSFDQLVAHGRQGLLKPHCRVWSSKSPKWCEAKDVAGLVFDGGRVSECWQRMSSPKCHPEEGPADRRIWPAESSRTETMRG